MVGSVRDLEKEGELLVLRGPELLWAHQVRGGKWRGEGNHRCHKRNEGKDGFVWLRLLQAPVKIS